MLLLLEKLNHTTYWNDACCRIILCCIWNKRLRFVFILYFTSIDSFHLKNIIFYSLMFVLYSVSFAIDLCKLLKNKLQIDELVMKVLFHKVSSSGSLFTQILSTFNSMLIRSMTIVDNKF